jgi:hypothetical protein
MTLKTLATRLDRIAAKTNKADKECIFCQQWYWTLTCATEALRTPTDTGYGDDAGLVVAQALHADRTFEETDPRVEAAMRKVSESRPHNPRCEVQCKDMWEKTINALAGVLVDYPRVAEAVVDAYEKYVMKPLESRCHYAMTGRGGGGI